VKPGWTFISLIKNRGVALRAIFFHVAVSTSSGRILHAVICNVMLSEQNSSRGGANFEVPFWAAGLVPLTGFVHAVVTKSLTVRKLVVWDCLSASNVPSWPISNEHLVSILLCIVSVCVDPHDRVECSRKVQNEMRMTGRGFHCRI